MSYHIKPTTPSHLQYLIESHHKLYLELFPGYLLKPKHHILTHYPGKNEKIGPFCDSFLHFDTKQFAKNLKLLQKNSASTINLPLTLATKFQLDLAFRFRKMHIIPDQCVLGESIDYIIDSSLYLDPANEFQLTEFNSLLRLNFHHCNEATYNCHGYKKVRWSLSTLTTMVRLFGLSNAVDWFLLTKKLNCLYFDAHFQAYRVENLNVIRLVNVQNLAVKKCFPWILNALSHQYVCPKVEL